MLLQVGIVDFVRDFALASNVQRSALYIAVMRLSFAMLILLALEETMEFISISVIECI